MPVVYIEIDHKYISSGMDHKYLFMFEIDHRYVI